MNHTVGLLGGGQLGRMFCTVARRMGYDVIVVDPDPAAPAKHFANEHLCLPYEDPRVLDTLLNRCIAVTTEFENVPATLLAALEEKLTVSPPSQAVATAQNRIFEKQFFKQHGFPVGHFVVLNNAEELDRKQKEIRYPAIIKTTRFGYDGKGQVRVGSEQDLLTTLKTQRDLFPVIVEEQISLRLEISVILGRNIEGQINVWPIAENKHRHGILDVTIAPARIGDELAQRARKIACDIAEKLNYVGVLAVEFFVTGIDTLLVNEMAPRPHNSAHFTLNACVTDQFEQQLRILCHLPMGSTEALTPAVMLNILGDVWEHGVPQWEKVLKESTASLHLYGKKEPRKGRKMGHITVLGHSASDALRKVETIKKTLQIPE
ncbi:MAG: 5-(carboxyamino)imidazole ribonucleotide synthase [Ferrovum sp. 37-45-19]|uniref:5-(carboxyamino)imidazole ribonucleotide synthase n=1 Tax=Ferrovum sp. JA12 TaxID=1356299 RepID=UPI000702E31B|nr:5-(carboxyamino)imidazole ribonucleotide synthase [Ferrovum sp. JA12]OYV79466.1 MAG: 5-(carboxyamino)imidazole ribonucleotide synthase [Ferrovum sp. 21-44-67]OYV94210.1 MAG: 5-(carboxyamino)imidazole ribonucleotide synthase [Ferrovum sp. 37-45-19]OZB31757.1 MAG: 5-(carboxyamino)imidazole ribonucleotide synthase [Ferrovum sp. 34-44-207]HQT81682.1 5-(carboxyamino)imidazole ribonucleotide synthase [Ferrovaceae bacterium]KRH78379.1 N5-carboxyaminoimidazole ribonucleotide synthase [Ferrovum sp. 